MKKQKRFKHSNFKPNLNLVLFLAFVPFLLLILLLIIPFIV